MQKNGENMKVKIALITIISSLFVFAASCGKKEENALKNIPLAVSLNVPISKVTLGSMENFYEATGTVKAKTTTQISANMLGRIVAFPVAEGDYVSRGQVLVEIDNRESQNQQQKANAGMKEAQAALIEIDKSVVAANAGVKTAEANRVLAEQTFARFKELYERKSASGQEFDEAQSRLKAATSEVERAKANVQAILSKKQQINAKIEQAKADIAGTKIYEGYGKITSPVSGIIVKKLAEKGAIASPGVPLLSIEDSSQYRLEAAVEESNSKMVRIGNRVNVKIDAIGEGEFFGVISEIVPSADASSRSLTVKIDLPANSLLRTGLYGLARFPIAGKQSISVPNTAIVQRGQLSGVFVVTTDGIAQFRIVTTGKTADGNVEILSGLSEGDEYVSADANRVNDGVKVR
ncbi:MAG TPA: efflux RND transporter periplasmic adaptor subunit [Pyrinomonadaceae bacterium]|nr:efflux RND transporter periplasmic adaptor subunit [Pyrinomonadaceae bacterium]